MHFVHLVTYSYCFCTPIGIKILQVKLEQGIEMLNILKNYETEMSILDDFDFYEERQKAMQERKAKQQVGLMGVGVVGDNEHRNAVALSGDFIKQMSKSFAQVVRMDEGSKEVTLTERASSASDAFILEDSLAAAVSSAHTS
jgi:hypothetical protein